VGTWVSVDGYGNSKNKKEIWGLVVSETQPFKACKKILNIGPRMRKSRYDFFQDCLECFIPPGPILKILMPGRAPIEPNTLKASQILNVFPNLKTLKRYGFQATTKSNKSLKAIANGEKVNVFGLVDSIGFPFSNLTKINIFEEGHPDYRSFYKKNRYSWFRDSATLIKRYQFFSNCETEWHANLIAPSVGCYLEKLKNSDYSQFLSPVVGFGDEGITGFGKELKAFFEKGQKICILLPSKGTGSLFCKSCKKNIRCQICDKVLVLSKNELKCIQCNQEWPKVKKCNECNSWLIALRQGVDHFKEWLLKKGFSDFEIEIVTSSQNEKQLKDSLARFKKGLAKVLLTTNFEIARENHGQKVLWVPYLKYFFIDDDFRSYENGWWRMNALNSFSSKNDIRLLFGFSGERIPPVDCFLQCSFSDFYRQEIEIRKQFDYPPFGEILMIISNRKISNFIYKGENIDDIASDLRYLRAFDGKGKESTHYAYVFQAAKINQDFKKFIKNFVLENENIRIYYEQKL
tara:strand:+ start:7169 stop:8722 length:1554 start_codon:yes stop_codon:yes gene_type:complete